MKYFASILEAEFTLKEIIIDDFINTYKYFVVGVLFFYGATDEVRIRYGLYAVLILNIVLAIQVVKFMPLAALVDGDLLQKRAIRVLDNRIGYYRSDLAVLLASAAWGFFSIKKLVNKKWFYYLCLSGSVISSLAMFLTGSRIGLVAWIIVAVFLSWYRWRGLVFLMPILLMVVFASIPAVQERMLQGISSDTDNATDYADEHNYDDSINTKSVTSGRTIIWPFVLEKISEAPILGYGRHAMQTTGLASFLYVEHGELFPHPHNAYLELVLDNGLLLAIPVLLYFLWFIREGISLLKRKDQEIITSLGGTTLAFLLGQLVGCLAGQSFYPMISQVSMWAMIFIMFRVRASSFQEETYTEEKVRPSYYST
jgi:O-antigen ligase